MQRNGLNASDEGENSAPIKARGRPFEFDDDLAIKCNDWGYGIDERIKHLVIWTKFDLDEETQGGDLTEKARAEIQAFVARNFYGNMAPQNVGCENRQGDMEADLEQVAWFKNWRSLKSVHAVEHFHVMLFDPDPNFLREVTGGDVPASEK